MCKNTTMYYFNMSPSEWLNILSAEEWGFLIKAFITTYKTKDMKFSFIFWLSICFFRSRHRMWQRAAVVKCHYCCFLRCFSAPQRVLLFNGYAWRWWKWHHHCMCIVCALVLYFTVVSIEAHKLSPQMHLFSVFLPFIAFYSSLIMFPFLLLCIRLHICAVHQHSSISYNHGKLNYTWEIVSNNYCFSAKQLRAWTYLSASTFIQLDKCVFHTYGPLLFSL